MKKTAYILLLACMTFISCSDDDCKLTYSSDSVVTGEATDITSNSAVISGYFSFYGEMNNLIGDFDYTELNDTLVVAKNELALVLMTLWNIQDPIDVTSAPDSLEIMLTPFDAQFMGAGFRISRYHDFRESTLHSSSDTRVRHYSLKAEGLTPSTTYYYKTALVIRPVYKVECPAINLSKFATAEDSFYDYYVYGNTREFTTLP